MPKRAMVIVATAAVGLGCGPGHDPATPQCASNAILEAASFVIVESPASGAVVTSPLVVRGCSRTYESNVIWQLRARDGEILGRGFTSGGGVEGPAPFVFQVHFEVAAGQVGALEVYEEDASEGEGFPPGRDLVPLVLTAADR